MEEFYKSISTPSWWIGVVVVGIVVNIVSVYVKSLVERVSLKIGGAWSRAATEAANQRAQWVQLLRSDQHAQLIMHAREQRLRTQAVHMLLHSVVFVVLGFLLGAPSCFFGTGGSLVIPREAYAPFGIAVFAFLYSHSAMSDASKCASLLKEATSDYPLPYNKH